MKIKLFLTIPLNILSIYRSIRRNIKTLNCRYSLELCVNNSRLVLNDFMQYLNRREKFKIRILDNSKYTSQNFNNPFLTNF